MLCNGIIGRCSTIISARREIRRLREKWLFSLPQSSFKRLCEGRVRVCWNALGANVKWSKSIFMFNNKSGITKRRITSNCELNLLFQFFKIFKWIDYNLTPTFIAGAHTRIPIVASLIFVFLWPWAGTSIFAL